MEVPERAVHGAAAYTFQDLLRAYGDVGLSAGRVVYVTGNLGALGPSVHRSKDALIEAHFQALIESVGSEGTLVVPTHSFLLCNTDTPYSPEKTASETGPLTEYVRKRPGAVRQFHPFSSRAAIGKYAAEVCGSSRHSYGRHTPFDRMLGLDALFVSVGMEPRDTCSIVHQCEFSMGVPYRYTKEFLHRVEREGRIELENFYLYVRYRNCDIKKDGNKKIFARFEQRHRVERSTLGKGIIHAYSMRDFYDSTTELMLEDPYAWVRRPPKDRPYQR